MFPACAGMNRVYFRGQGPLFSVPRMRGDEPDYTDEPGSLVECSPHARG